MLGESSYLYCTIKNPDYQGTIINLLEFNKLSKELTIVIYPEIIVGNPLNSSFVVRWLLNSPKIIAGDDIYDKNDLVFKFVPNLKTNNEDKVCGELRAVELYLDIFKDLKYPRITKNAHFIHKGKNKNLIYHPTDSVLLQTHENFYDRAKLFNRIENFLSYDEMTFVSIQAALCGCNSIVVPKENLSKEEWSKNPFFKYSAHS